MAKKINKTPGKSAKATSAALTADGFSKELLSFASKEELFKITRYFKQREKDAESDMFIGVRMGQVFALAKKYSGMLLPDIEKLLESPIHEMRVGAVSIMDFQARSNAITEERKKDLFQLYIKRHDRINNWDLVDRSAPYVVGGYLYDKSRQILYKLAKSKNAWERRTAIVSTYYFIRKGDLDDTFKIANILVHDEEDLVQKATGGWIREAGKKDQRKLLQFLDKHAATMPRTMLRYAVEKLTPKQKKYYMDLKIQPGK